MPSTVEKHTVTVPVPVPEKAELTAWRRAIAAGEPEKFEEYLLDALLFEFEFELSGSADPGDFLRSPA